MKVLLKRFHLNGNTIGFHPQTQMLELHNKLIQWNLYEADTFRTFRSVRLIEGVRSIEVVKIGQCLVTINMQRLLYTVIKLHVVKEAIQSSNLSPFITNFNLFGNAKTLTDFSTYFKDIIQVTIVNSVRCPLNRRF